MRKIFGNQRTSSDNAFAQLNEKMYAKRSANIYDAPVITDSCKSQQDKRRSPSKR